MNTIILEKLQILRYVKMSNVMRREPVTATISLITALFLFPSPSPSRDKER